MEVVYYQLAIIVSLIISRVIGKKLFFWVLAGWTVWTLIMLTTFSPLFFIQSLTIGGTCFLLNKLSRQNSKIKQLEAVKSKLTNEQLAKIEDILDERIRPLSTKQHYNFLLDKLQNAQFELLILSGWIGSQVIDRQFASMLKKRLESGLTVYIGYGYESLGRHEMTASAQKALERLQKLSSQFPDQIHIGSFANHEKILVVDKSVVVFGSANWLSNRKYVNSESSIVINDEKLASRETERIKKLVIENTAYSDKAMMV